MKYPVELRVDEKGKGWIGEKRAWSNTDRLVFFVVLVMIFLSAARTPVDTDMWWHLRAGETTWTQGRPLLHDLFSFTRLGQPWINHSWLSQVGMYLLFDWGGYLAIGLFVALLATGMIALVFLQQDGPALLRALLLVLITAVVAVVWTPRPQTTSLFLFALTGYVLYLYKWRQRDHIWILVPLFILWSNLHGGYPLGLLSIGAIVAGEILNHALGYQSHYVLSWRRVRKLALMGVLCALVVAVNPNGVDAWLIPFQTVSVGALQNYVSEWASPDFHELVQQPLLWLVFALLGAIGLSRQRLDGSDLAGLVIFGMLAFIARRNYGPFALVAAPVLSRHLWILINDLKLRWHTKTHEAIREVPEGKVALEGKSEQVRIPSWKKGVNLGLVALLSLIAIGKLYFVTHPAFVDPYLRTAYPVDAASWMQAQGLEKNVFNEYAWGGYMVWFLRQTPVFVDGRTDLFGDEIIGEWITVVQGGEGWETTLEHWQVDIALLDPGRPVVPLLIETGWEVLYRDDQAILLGR
jgi:hypothetical protein